MVSNKKLPQMFTDGNQVITKDTLFTTYYLIRRCSSQDYRIGFGCTKVECFFKFL